MNATVKGPETLAKNNTFVRYADNNERMANAQPAAASFFLSSAHGVAGGAQGFPRPLEERPFDKSLNEREPAGTWVQQTAYAGPQQEDGRARHHLSEGVQMKPPQETWSLGQTKIQDEM